MSTPLVAVRGPSASVVAVEDGVSYACSVRALAATRWRPFLVYCALVLTVNAMRAHTVLPFTERVPTGSLLDDVPMLHTVLLVVLIAPSVFVALIGVEALHLRGAAHALASLAAIGAGVAMGLSVAAPAFGGTVAGHLVGREIVATHAAFIAREVWVYLASGMLLVAYFASREREAEYARLAQATELERMRAERAMAASRLKVLQASVEPELLFGTLGDVRELFMREPAVADALLDDLIAYLRAALPQMRGESSTLAAEAGLATTYLRVSAPARASRLRVSCSVDPALGPRAFPPMVLLPLVQTLARARPAALDLASEHDAPARAARISLTAVEPAVAVEWSDPMLNTLRARLAQEIGAGASLEVATDRATITLPASA